MSITGWPDSPPTRVGMSLGDITASLYTAIGSMQPFTSAQFRRRAKDRYFHARLSGFYSGKCTGSFSG